MAGERRLSGWLRLWIVLAGLIWLWGIGQTISNAGSFVPFSLSRDEICSRYADD